MSLKIITILVFAWTLSPPLPAADLGREKRIAEQIEETIFDGDPVYLKDGDHEFLGVYMRTDQQPARGAALILHGRGANPDWVDVVHPLRVGLPSHGWDTLSIQLPVAHESASEREWLETVPQAATRIQAALTFLSERNIFNTTLVAHSFGARMAADYLAGSPPEQITAFVAIGMSADPARRQAGNLAALRKIQLPVLDLYGERDLPAVLDSARERKLAARDAENDHYRQYQTPGADHFFRGQEQQLLSIVRSWLYKEAAGDEISLD